MKPSVLPEGEWPRVLRALRFSAWRFEQQPSYATDLESGWPDRWHAGDLTPPDFIVEWAESVVRPHVAGGGTIARVRVVDDPMTPTQRWADWAAEVNRDAGERIDLITRVEVEQLGVVDDPRVDWWLVDDATLLQMTHDSKGGRSSVILGDDRAVARAQQIRRLVTEAIARR